MFMENFVYMSMDVYSILVDDFYLLVFWCSKYYRFVQWDPLQVGSFCPFNRSFYLLYDIVEN